MIMTQLTSGVVLEALRAWTLHVSAVLQLGD
jgi:hypothetical protein